MYRWVQNLDDMQDNLLHGWRATVRPIHYSLCATRLLCRIVGVERLRGASATFLDDGRLTIDWHGISFTQDGPNEFCEENLQLFGCFGLRMTDEWISVHEHVSPKYVSDANTVQLEDLASQILHAAGHTERRRALQSFDRADLEREAELRLFVQGGGRIDFDVQTDVREAFVPTEADAEAVRPLLGTAEVLVLPSPTLPELSQGLWRTTDRSQ